MKDPPTRSRVWLLTGGVLVALLGGFEALLLEISSGYFSAGYNSPSLAGLVPIAGFFAAGIAIDAFVVLCIWALCLPLLRRLRSGGLQAYLLATSAALGLPVAFDLVWHMLHALLGRMISFSLLWELAGRSSVEMVSQALSHLPAGIWMAGILALGLLVLVPATRALDRRLVGGSQRLAAPRTAPVAWGALACALLSSVLLFNRAAFLSDIRYGLEQKAGATVISLLLHHATDFDRDGAGMLSRPRDPAAFDASIHAYAVDLPDNGIDENGLAGDHHAGFVPPRPIPPPAEVGPARPHVLLVLLEGVRADMLGKKLGELEITPFFNQLARAGASSAHAYVHSPYTIHTREHLFSGRYAMKSGEPTLIDDFQKLGYRVAYFSGQDESFGKSEALLGVERADHFYDARQDRDRRTGRGASRGALQVSWKLLSQHVNALLDTHDPNKPLFLYANFSDTHYPYDHAELDDVLGVEPLARSEIGAERADRVWETYANSVANVDRATGQLFRAWRERLGPDGVFLLLSDHGEALFEDGHLGHGQFLDDAQTRTPLLVSGIGGEWPEPLGPADLRGLLLRNLSTPGDHPTWVRPPNRRVMQFLPKLARPARIGWRDLEGRVVYDLRSGQLQEFGPGDEPRALAPAREGELLTELVQSWEALRLDFAGR